MRKITTKKAGRYVHIAIISVFIMVFAVWLVKFIGNRAYASIIDFTTPWVRHTIHGYSTGSTLSGADGVHLLDINGDGLLDVTSPWEQSAKVTVSLHPAAGSDPTMAWPTVVVPCTMNAIEDAKFADVDGDGNWDVITAGDAGQRIYVAFGPASSSILTPSAWTCMTIAASGGVGVVQNWLQVAHADMDGDGIKDVVAGGRTTGSGASLKQGQVGYFTNPTGGWRTGTAYVWHQIGLVGVDWSLIPMDVDGDSDLDLIVSDSAQIGTSSSMMGSRWLESPVSVSGSKWINHMIHSYKGAEQLARFLHAEPGRVIDGSSRDTGTSFVGIRTMANCSTWSSVSVPWPSDVGHYNAVRPADIDGDSLEDLVFSTHHADSDYTTPPQDLSGVFWLKNNGAGGWQRGEISGVDGVKYDNLELVDIDGDGDLDVVTSEQGMAGVTPAADKFGIIWYENPSVSP